jgi:hypothetical protein
MFTYWGDHGLGDTFRVPIGKGKVIESINAMEYAWIMDVTNSSGERVQMSRFVIADGKVLGNCDDDFYDEPCAYFVYEIDNGGLLEFRDPLSFAQECDRKGVAGPGTDGGLRNELPSLLGRLEVLAVALRRAPDFACRSASSCPPLADEGSREGRTRLLVVMPRSIALIVLLIAGAA